MRPIGRLIQRDQIDQPKIRRDLGDDDRHRNLKRVRDEVAVVLRHQVSAILLHRFGWRDLLARMPHLGHKRSISGRLDIEHQIFDLLLAHGHARGKGLLATQRSKKQAGAAVSVRSALGIYSRQIDLLDFALRLTYASTVLPLQKRIWTSTHVTSPLL